MKPLLLVRVYVAAVAVVAALTLSAALLISGMPRLMQASYDDALRESLTGALTDQADIRVTYNSHNVSSDLREPGQFESRDNRFRTLLPKPLAALVRPPGVGTGHYSAKTFNTPINGAGGAFLNLAWLSDAAQRVEWVRGGAPGATSRVFWAGESARPDPGRTVSEAAPRGIRLFEVGVSEEAAAKLDYELGDVRVLGNSHFVAVRVTGIFKARNPAEPYWRHNLDVLHVNFVTKPGSPDVDTYLTALISEDGLAYLSGADRQLAYSWVLSTDPNRADSLGVPEVVQGITGFERQIALEENVGFDQYRVVSGLPGLLATFIAELATAQTIMYLVLGGLLIVALGVIVLAVQLLVERMDSGLSLVRARGGSLRQITWTGTAVVAVAVGPPALLGYLLSYAVPGPATPIVHAGPVILVLAAVCFALVRLARSHRTPLHERRGDVVAARPSARRITLEIMVIALALAGAYLLRTRGVTTQVAAQGQDPFLLLVPIALTVAAALVTLRCYPYPLRLAARLAARRRPAVPFLGLTRAARAKSFAVLPVLILLPALAVSVFAAVVSSGISATQEQAAWQSVGAPIKLSRDSEIPPDAIERVRRMAGVEQVVPVLNGTAQIGLGAQKTAVVAIDLAEYRRLMAGTPIDMPVPPARAGITALVSPDLRGRSTLEIGLFTRMTLTPTGVLSSMPGFYAKGNFVVIPYESLGQAGGRSQANTLLVRGDADPAALAAAVKGAPLRVESYDLELAAIQDRPLTGTVQLTLAIVTVALAVYALIAVIIALVITAADRAGALSFLRTLGLSARQAQRLTVLEISPMIVLTALAGLALGLVLPAALGPGVDLATYAGDLAVGDYELDLITPTLLAAGLTVVAIVGAYAHTAISRRRALGSVLRVGD